ncbi:MAG: Sfum_1244 family protein [Gallionellaceae bacterium]
MFNLQQTIAAVQTNCDIADARHARDMSMCNYLLAMRDFYRWERQIPFVQPLNKGDIRDWLSQREAKWNEVEEINYLPIPVAGNDYDHFDTAAINCALKEHGLVYGSGYGNWGRPHFFLGQLLRCEKSHNISILVSGHEYARNMAAPPAALNRDTVFLRIDAMQRWLLDKVEVWELNKGNSALKATLDCYESGEDVESKLALIAEQEGDTLILHELGEAMAGKMLGETWHEMLSSFQSRRHELLARAVRDNLADCLVTLPELIERDKTCSLHFYFSNFDGLRRGLFPSLAYAYDHWHKDGDILELQNAIEAGYTHWLRVAQDLVSAWIDDPATAETMIENYGENFSKLAL